MKHSRTKWLFVGLTLLSCTGSGPNAPGEKVDAPILAARPGSRFESAGLPQGLGRDLVVAHCTACHSDKLVQQNRATADGWRDIIRWMQRTQGLWRLDPQTENGIVGYLSTHYGRSKEADDARRPPLPPALMPTGETNP